MDKSEIAIVEFFKAEYPHLSRASSFEEIKYEVLTPAECVVIIEKYYETKK